MSIKKMGALLNIDPHTNLVIADQMFSTQARSKQFYPLQFK
jgi:hypothetical protein